VWAERKVAAKIRKEAAGEGMAAQLSVDEGDGAGFSGVGRSFLIDGGRKPPSAGRKGASAGGKGASRWRKEALLRIG